MPPKKVLKPDKGQQSLFSFGLGRQATAASESDDAPVEGEPDTGTGSAELETETESGEAGSSEQNVGKSRRRFVPAWANMFKWLTFDKDKDKMFCSTCQLAGKSNALIHTRMFKFLQITFT